MILGRTLNQSRIMYNQIVHPTAATGLIRSASVRDPPRPLDIASSKRPFTSEGPLSAPSTGRYQEIQPKPAGLGSLLNPPSSEEPPKKKRGRPTKAETEVRREAARARGEVYQPLRRESTLSAVPGPSFAAQAARAVMTPQPPSGPKSTGTSESSSGKRRRGRPPKSEAEIGRSPERPAMSVEHETPSRGYPDILSRDPAEGSSISTFRAPRGGGV